MQHRRPGPRWRRLRTEVDEAIVFATLARPRHRRLPLKLLGHRGEPPATRRGHRDTTDALERTAASPASQRDAGARRCAARRARRGGPALRGAAVASAAGSRASASTPTTPRSPGRRGTASAGTPARSTATTRVASTVTATSSSTSRPSTRWRSSASSRAGWLRARVTATRGGAAALHRLADDPRAERVHPRRNDRRHPRGEDRATRRSASPRGCPGSGCRCLADPVAGAAAEVLEVGSDEGWQAWTAVEDFAASGPDDRHFILDAAAGEVMFGPAVRQADGSVRQYGRVPPAGDAAADARVQRSAAAAAATSPAARSACSSRRSPTSARSRTAGPRRAGWTARTIENAKRARAARAPRPRPRGHRRGLRADHPRGRARGRPGALRPRRRRRRRGVGARSWWCPRLPDERGRLALRAARPRARPRLARVAEPPRRVPAGGHPRASSSLRCTGASPSSRGLMAPPPGRAPRGSRRPASMPSTRTSTR